MDIDFSKLTSTFNQTVIEPRDIFMALPKKLTYMDILEMFKLKFGSNGSPSVMKRIR